MLYIAKVLNTDTLNFDNVDMNIVNADYYHQAHGNSRDHKVHPAIVNMTTAGIFGGTSFNPTFPIVRTGMRATDNYVSYTSCAGNMVMVFVGHDDNMYVALDGVRHGLQNPIYQCLKLLGIQWSDLELETVIYVTRNPSAGPVDIDLEPEFDEDQIVSTQDEWVDAENVQYEVNSLFDTDDLITLIAEIADESDVITCLQKRLHWEGMHCFSKEALSLVTPEMITYPSDPELWEGNLVTTLRGITVRCIAFEGGGREHNFAKRITMRRANSKTETIEFTEYANRVSVQKLTKDIDNA